MKAALIKSFREEQAGFRMGISCTDHVFTTIRNIIEVFRGHHSGKQLFEIYKIHEELSLAFCALFRGQPTIKCSVGPENDSSFM